MSDKKDSQDRTKNRTDLAEDRTEWAEDRTVMANERTFAGWMRTGLAAVGIGVGFNALFNTMEPIWVPKTIATGFILIGIFVFWSAQKEGCKVQARLNAHQAEPIATTNLQLIAGLMALASAALAVAIWALRFPDA